MSISHIPLIANMVHSRISRFNFQEVVGRYWYSHCYQWLTNHNNLSLVYCITCVMHKFPLPKFPQAVTLILDHNALDERKKIFCVTTSLETKLLKTLKIDATHFYDNDLLLRQENWKKIVCLKSWYNNYLKKNIDLMSLAQRTCSKWASLRSSQ